MVTDNNIETYDFIIFGAGIFGLYAGNALADNGKRVLILEHDSEIFGRSSLVNQARVHNGYHYPRSFSTAKKSAGYFDRFSKEFSFAVNGAFDKIYAIARNYSLTNPEQFVKFCNFAEIPHEEIHIDRYFKHQTTAAAYKTREHAFCADRIKDYYLSLLNKKTNVDIILNSRIVDIEHDCGEYLISHSSGKRLKTGSVLNATYASTNQILQRFNLDTFQLKYQLCEVILCDVDQALKDVGLTVMDGPFFSLTPFGFNTHSLTAVTYTPHQECTSALPFFPCQTDTPDCSEKQLANCNSCVNKPATSWEPMKQMAKKFLRDDLLFTYKQSLFAVKTILSNAEIDDARHTVIKKHSQNPNFYSILSGKINTIYDLDEIIEA